MAAAEANALLDLITQAGAFAQKTASGWYKASEALTLFPVRLAVLKQQSKSWASLLNRYGMSADPFIGPVLEEAVQLLAREQLKLEQLQQNCCLTICRKLLFPESLIGALDSVITAFQTLPELITEQEIRRQQLEKVSLYRVARLPFLPDSKFVPFEVCIAKVRRALESETVGPVVVISGGPGQGKSSMAKYLACLYQDGIDPLLGTHVIATPKKFVDGVFFLSCGQKADSRSLLLQLWQDLGYQTLSSDQGQASPVDEMPSTSEEAMHKQLSARLANLNVLIILDDVWGHLIVDRLLVQQQGIKYLITTQVTRLWTDSTCVDIPISPPTPLEANRILANHVKGFPQEVTPDIQDQINQIIEKSASNPLVLANVATNIGVGKALQLQEYKTTLQYLSDLQDGDDKRPVSLFGRTYSKRTMRASVEMALSSFSNEEQTLLFLACVCENQAVPEVVFKTLFKIVHSSLAKFSRCCEQLETINFIQIESKTDPSTDIPQRSWSLHTMRQSCISLIKKDEIALMVSKLLENNQTDNIVAILLVLYGQESWRNQAASTLGLRISQFVNDTSASGSLKLFSIQAFVRLLNADGEEGWQKQSHQVTKQILEDYLVSGELKEKMIVELLCIQQTMSGACQALLQLAILDQKPLFKDNNSQILHMLIKFIQETKDNSRVGEVLHFLSTLSCYNLGAAIKMGSHSGLLETLVALLEVQVSTTVQVLAIRILGDLSKNVTDNASRIGSYPGALERLVGFLEEGVSLDVQASAILTLGYLSISEIDNATKIGSYPGVVDKLIGFLGQEVTLGPQANAVSTLGTLSKVVDNATKIGSYPGAMERLIELLGEGVSPYVQANAASTLGILSAHVMDNAITIMSYPDGIKRLVDLLQEGVHSDVQTNVASTLAGLSEVHIDNAIKIGSYPGAVEGLVGLLGQKASGELIRVVQWSPTLSSELDHFPQLVRTRVCAKTRYGSFPGMGETFTEVFKNGQSSDVRNNAAEASRMGVAFVEVFKEGQSSGVQNNAALALGLLSKHVADNAIKIGSYPGAVERLVGLLEHQDLQATSIFALGLLSKDVANNAIKIGSYPGAIERLVQLIGEGVSSDVQLNAAWALGELSTDVVDNATKIVSYPTTIESLVRLLGDEAGPFVQENAARALGHLSKHSTKIESYPGVVEKLARLSEKGVSPRVQETAAWALGCFSKNAVVDSTRTVSCP